MDKLNIYICENFFPEFNRVIEKEKFDDVVIRQYPCMCEHKGNKAETAKCIQDTINNGDKGIVLCSKYCDFIYLIKEGSTFEIRSTNYCFNHLANEQFINYILQKGGYIIGLGWLNSWREHLRIAGFDKDTARCFYQECFNELVFFDGGIDISIEDNLKELSEYLGLPYVIIPFELKCIELMIKSAVYEWRLHNKSEEYIKSVSELQSQCAEYSAILDLMGKIAINSNKRDAIEKIKEIFMIIFGAQQFKYWDDNCENESVPNDIKDLFLNYEKAYLLIKEENRFCIKIQWNNKVFGAIDASEFLYPEYIEKYLNFAIEIVEICGLVFSNNEQYEKILKSEKELQYLSYHDSMTDMYNRTYINDILNKKSNWNYVTVFMFDIDKLKYVNDNFGHLYGDKLILNTANIIKKCFRETDIVARIGGDEFVAILRETNRETAELIMNRINEEISFYNNNIQEPYLKISISIGFSVQEKQDEFIEAIMQKADELMYIDKMRKPRL